MPFKAALTHLSGEAYGPKTLEDFVGLYPKGKLRWCRAGLVKLIPRKA